MGLFSKKTKEQVGSVQYTDPSKPNYANPNDNGSRFPTCPQCMANRNTWTGTGTEYTPRERTAPTPASAPVEVPQGIPVEIPQGIPVGKDSVFSKR